MTPVQKDAFAYLLDGGSLYSRGHNFGVRNKNHILVMIIQERTAKKIKQLCRKHKGGFWVINLSLIRTLHNNSWLKKTYNDQRG